MTRLRRLALQRHQRVDFLFHGSARGLQVAACLQVRPELRRGAEHATETEHGVGRDDARSLLAYFEAQVERLTDELTEARTEMRGVRYEAESLRVEAGRAQVFAALVEAERARSAEIRVERDRLATGMPLAPDARVPGVQAAAAAGVLSGGDPSTQIAGTPAVAMEAEPA